MKRTILEVENNQEENTKTEVSDKKEQEKAPPKRNLPANVQNHIRHDSSSRRPAPQSVDVKEKQTTQPVFDYNQYIHTYAFEAEYQGFLKLANHSKNKDDSKLDGYIRDMKVDPQKNVLVSYGFILPKDYEAVAKIAHAYINLVCETNGFELRLDYGKNQRKHKKSHRGSQRHRHSQEQTSPKKRRKLNVGCAVFHDKTTNSKTMVLVLSGKKTKDSLYRKDAMINDYISQVFKQDRSNNFYVQQIKGFMGADKQFDDIKHVCDQVSDAFISMQKILKDPRGTDSNYFYGCSEPVLADECEKFLNQDRENHTIEGTVEFDFIVEEKNHRQVVTRFIPQESCPTSCQVHNKAGYYKNLRSALQQSQPRATSIKNSMVERVQVETKLLQTLENKKLEMEEKKAQVEKQLSATITDLEEVRKQRKKAQEDSKSLPSAAALTEKETALKEEDELSQTVSNLISDHDNLLLSYREESLAYEAMLLKQVSHINRQIISIQNDISELKLELEQTNDFPSIAEINQLSDDLASEINRKKDEIISCMNIVKESRQAYEEKCQDLEKTKHLVLHYKTEIKSEIELNHEQQNQKQKSFLLFDQSQSQISQLKLEKTKLSTDIDNSSHELVCWKRYQIQSMQERISVHSSLFKNRDQKQSDSSHSAQQRPTKTYQS